MNVEGNNDQATVLSSTQQVMEMALDHVVGAASGGPRPLHLSFDIDAVDPSLAPATGTRVPGGLSYREAHYVCEALAESGLLGSMDLVEINPDAGTASGGSAATVGLGVELVGSALGQCIMLPPQILSSNTT
jgi:arginase